MLPTRLSPIVNQFFRRTCATAWDTCPAGAIAVLVFVVFSGPWLCGQDAIEQAEIPLIDQQPFDLITLTSEAGGASVKVFPLPFPDRKVPASPQPGDRLSVVIVRFPERQYEVLWRDIASVGIYEQRILDEALRKLEEKDFIAAFQNLSYLMKNYPNTPRLEALRQEFLLKSAAERYQSGEFPQTLSALEELRVTAPNYQAATVLKVLSQVADGLIMAYQRSGDLGSAKTLLTRLSQQYGANLPVVGIWDKKLEALALEKRDEATQLLQEKKFRAARKAASEMLSILPDIQSAQELIARINREHPMVTVGVMQRSGSLDPASLLNWSARRAGLLVDQPIFRFLETGAEGGRYGFALGAAHLSDDRQQLILSLDSNVPSQLNAFGLAQVLLGRADPTHADYDPSWASIFQSVSIPSSSQVLVQLKRPNVLPNALLQWTTADASEGTSLLPGPYALNMRGDREVSFELRDATAKSGLPLEIIEVFYDDPKQAVNDLLRGDIDVLDQVYPADARRLAIDPRVRVGSYQLPTTHMLIPISDDPYLANVKFRRALLYATNREGMLAGELLGSSDPEDGRLVSGPFPLGVGQADQLSYAYNTQVLPAEYNPQLARLLLVMAEQELQQAAKAARQAPPPLKKLRVGCPNYEFARVAVQAMIQQWTIVGIPAEMVIVENDQLSSPDCDLIYVTATMWEPATDIERLLGGNGLAATDNPFIVQALEALRVSRNWREVRTSLQDLHQLIDYHLPVLPLWQIKDRFAYVRYLEGLEDHPVSLYQDVSAWRVNVGAPAATVR